MLLFDQNLSYKLPQLIHSAFPGCKHVRDFKLASSSDPDIWTCATENQLVIVTQDIDFLNISSVYGHPPKVIHIAAGNSTTAQIRELLMINQKNIRSFLNNSEQSYLIVT